MEEVIPLFKSHYSIGKSILTLEDLGEGINGGPDSIIEICAQNKLKEFYLVDDSMSGFLQAHINSKKNNLKLIFGLRLTVCQDMEEKTPESLKNCHKCIIFIKNQEGYEKLVKIFTIASKEGFYYEPRIDYATLTDLWSNDSLKLCIPFYDSFLHKNFLENHSCVPQLDFCPLTFFIEDNDLPFDYIIKQKVDDYLKLDSSYDSMRVQSIYYRDKSDFKSYLTFRCINNRSTLDKPNLEHMCSENFCFENWSNKVGVEPVKNNTKVELKIEDKKVEKEFDFSDCDDIAQQGMSIFKKYYDPTLEIEDIQGQSYSVGDFRMKKGPLIGKRGELKVETYSFEGNGRHSEGFFIEHTSRTKTRRVPKKPKLNGGPYRAVNEGCARYVHLMLPDRTAYWFNPKELCQRVEEYARKHKPESKPVKQKDGSGYTWGYVIPKKIVSDLITRMEKIA